MTRSSGGVDAATRRCGLLLVDAMGCVYRAYHAIRNLSTSDGRPTNALFGFIRQLEYLTRSIAPEFVGVVFDGGLPAVRLETLPTYKAQRPSMPDGMREQLPAISNYLALAGYRSVRIEGEEADDAIASLATRFVSEGCGAVAIASADKDFMQLVGQDISLVASVKGELKWTGPEEVFKKTGVRPVEIVDWLAMIGDNCDNIPGVPGIGPITAAAILMEVESLERVWECPSCLNSKRLAGILVAGREIIERNRRMMRLNSELDLDVEWANYRRGRPDISGLAAFFREMEFGRMAAELAQPTLF